MHHKRLVPLVLTFVVLLAAAMAAAADKPGEENKQTGLGLYVTAGEAYGLWQADRDRVFVIDCRTPEEYAFVGHAPMAVNIPGWFMSYEIKEKAKSYAMRPNEAFVELVKARFKPGDTLLIMCRSGTRSAASVNRLAKAGFTKVYSIIDGFEGETDKTPGSPTAGQRVLGGWRNSGLPWTYELDPRLAYREGQSPRRAATAG